MFKHRRGRPRALAAALITLYTIGAHTSAENSTAECPQCDSTGATRLVSVRDAIEMRRLAHPEYFAGAPSRGRVAGISPDGRWFLTVLRKGDLASNTNLYSVQRWSAAGAAKGNAQPKVVLEMRSSSIRDAIDSSSIVWSEDNRTIVFLGEDAGEEHQVFSLDTQSGVRKRLTNHPTSVRAFAFNPSRSHMAFTAERPHQSLWNDRTRRHGALVTNQYLADLLTGRDGYRFRGREEEFELFVSNEKGIKSLPVQRELAAGGPWISPDAAFVIVPVFLAREEVPSEWSEYRDPLIGYLLAFDKSGGHGASLASALRAYEIVSTKGDGSRALLTAPLRVPVAPVWAPNSRSVIVSDTFLPLDTQDPAGRDVRKQRPFTVEVELTTGRIQEVGERCVRALAWDPAMQEVSCIAERDGDDLARAFFRKSDGRWQEVRRSLAAPERFEVILREDMNTPPKLYFRAARRGRDILLQDLNPQFKGLKLARVEEVTWEWSAGRSIRGGLYYPPNHDPKRRHPLVIQTHHWQRDRFWIDGPWSTAYAAQPLAARGIMVLQLDDAYVPVHRATDGTLREVENALAIYRTAIAELDRRGLIDAGKVGVIGFSHTCFYVKWALAHAPTLFAAATVAEGEDGGYVQYLTGMNNYVDERSLYGGPPFGEHLPAWVRLAPGFNLHRVRTPLWINSLNARFLLLDWEWFDGLRMLGKPVEMVVFDNEQHMLQQPARRLTSLETNVDWFDFWLNGREEPASAKNDQYVRWRKLRELHEANLWGGKVPGSGVCAGRPARSQRVQVSYDEDVASHIGLKSCAVHREM